MKLSLVSYLDPKSSRMVRELQQKLSKVTGSTASLRSWEPHVTVGDGVRVNTNELERLKKQVEAISNQTSTFKLELRGIGSLDNWVSGNDESATPYVIYLDVVLNADLIRVVKNIKLVSCQYDKWYFMPQPYIPHCTLAFRDLSKEGYERGLEYLEKAIPNLTATIDHVALVEKLPNIDRELTRYSFVS